MFVVTLREGIEAFLIVAITAPTCARPGGTRCCHRYVGYGRRGPAVNYFGVFLAEFAVQPVWEGLLAVAAAAMVISMVIYICGRHDTACEYRNRVEAAMNEPGHGAWIGIFLFVLLMMTREGMETALITATLARQTGSGQLLCGRGARHIRRGRARVAWSRYGHRVNLALFFPGDLDFPDPVCGAVAVYSFTNSPRRGRCRWTTSTGTTNRGMGQGTYGQLVTYGLVLLPVAWLIVAHLRGQKIIQAAR